MLREKLTESLKQAMRAKQARKVTTVRLILAAIKDRDIAARTDDKSEQDDDAAIKEILAKMVKQRAESIKAYEEAGRCELAEREREEVTIIQEFLPRQMSEEETARACRDVVQDVGAASLKDIGRCMGALKARYAGQMDFARASAQVKELLS